MDREAWWATIHRVAESDMTEVTEQAAQPLQSANKGTSVCTEQHCRECT